MQLFISLFLATSLSVANPCLAYARFMNEGENTIILFEKRKCNSCKACYKLEM